MVNTKDRFVIKPLAPFMQKAVLLSITPRVRKHHLPTVPQITCVQSRGIHSRAPQDLRDAGGGDDVNFSGAGSGWGTSELPALRPDGCLASPT